MTAVPEKCAGPTGPGITPLPCTNPGSLPRCQLCPKSPTYWRNTAGQEDQTTDTAGAL